MNMKAAEQHTKNQEEIHTHTAQKRNEYPGKTEKNTEKQIAVCGERETR